MSLTPVIIFFCRLFLPLCFATWLHDFLPSFSTFVVLSFGLPLPLVPLFLWMKTFTLIGKDLLAH